MERYFIRNCLGQIVGNPKGYTTYKGASMIFNRQKMQVELIDLAHELGVKGSSQNSVLIGSIKLEKVGEEPVKSLTIVRVEGQTGRGMYDHLWFDCGLPNDSAHPTVLSDSLYQKSLAKNGFGHTWEPRGHRFGFLNLDMLRRWIYSDDWVTALSDRGAVLCTYSVPVDSVIVGRTQVTFDYEKAVCLYRKPLASVLEQD
jgi:hypothetical protein